MDIYYGYSQDKRDEFIKLKVDIELATKGNYNGLFTYNDYIIKTMYPLNKSSIESLTNKINYIKDNYLNNNNIYFTIIPDKNYFVPNLKIDYNELENIMKQNLSDITYIDIFPLDGFPDDEKEYNIYADKLLKEYNDLTNSRIDGYKMAIYRWKRVVKCIIKYPLYFAKKIIPWKKRQLNLIDNMKKYKYEDSKNVAFILSAYKKKEILNKKIYDDIILVQFEDEKFNAPSGYDDYLKALYGNYMELPPIEKRKTHHFFDAYWKD